MSATPDWLLRNEFALCPCGCVGKRRKGSYLRKTVAGGAQLLRQAMVSGEAAARRGLLQRLDPRVKILALIGVLVVSAFLHNPGALALVYAGTLTAAAASALPIGFFVKRVWLFVPIFTGIVVIPATLSPVTPGDVVLTLWHWHGHAVGFTAQGLHAAGLIVTRVAVSISLVVLITLTTAWPRLLAALRAVGVPKMFVLIVGMAYRYIFLLLAAVQDMYQARQARTVGAPRHDRGARAFVAASAGALVGKANQLADEVHQAMTSRGYRGDAVMLDRFRLAARDGVFVLGAAGFAAAAVVVDVLIGR